MNSHRVKNISSAKAYKKHTACIPKKQVRYEKEEESRKPFQSYLLAGQADSAKKAG